MSLNPKNVEQLLIRDARARRTTVKGIEWLNEFLTQYATDIAKLAIEMSRHAGRVTVKDDDIVAAHTVIANRRSKHTYLVSPKKNTAIDACLLMGFTISINKNMTIEQLEQLPTDRSQTRQARAWLLW